MKTKPTVDSDQNNSINDDDDEMIVSLYHDPLGWNDIPSFRIMDPSGTIFTLDNCRLHGMFAIGHITHVNDQKVRSRKRKPPEWAVTHFRSGTIFGTWATPELAETHADSLFPLYDWSHPNLDGMSVLISKAVAAVPNIITATLDDDTPPCDPRFPDVITIN
jgi:hypothetical protein